MNSRCSYTVMLILFVLTSVSGLGCSESGPSTAEVSGEVSLDGKPFTGAAVRFYNAQLGGGAFNLDERGQFKSPQPLVVGEYLVSMDRPGPIIGENPGDMTFPEDQTKQLDQKYLSGSKSGLVARVSVSEENHFQFQVNGAPGSQRKSSGGPVPQVIPPISGGS